MNNYELADALDRSIGLALSAEEALSPDTSDTYLDTYEELCRNNSEIIAKSIRFVADMEKLMSEKTHLSFYRGEVRYYFQLRNEDRAIEFMFKSHVTDNLFTIVQKAVDTLENNE